MSRSTCATIKPFMAMDILARAVQLEQQGERIIHLEIGQPDFPTPECVKEAAIQAVRDGKTGYTNCLGILPLREAICGYYKREYGVNVDPECVVVTQGSAPGLMMLLTALCNDGEEVIIPGPSYACYEGVINFAGAKALRIPSKEEDGFQLNPEEVRKRIGPKTAGIIVNSPSNPGGTLVSRERFQALADLGKTIVSDEIYHGLVYEGKAVSALEITDNCLIADGFSKRYAMTGWRLGWLVVPRAMVRVMEILQQNLFICACSISQWAGVAAINGAAAEVKRMNAEYDRRRVLITNGLKKLGFGVDSSPAGAFYVLANARHLGKDSMALAFDLLDKAGVGVAPGVDFGPEAEGYLRFSYASSVENIEEAMARLKKYLESR